MTPKRIIVVLLDPPDPFGNAGARWYYVLLKGLSERGYSCTCFTSCRDRAEAQRTLALFPQPDFDVRCYERPAREPFGKLRTFVYPHSRMLSAELLRDLNAELARGYDVLHLEQLWSGWAGLKHTERAFINVHYLFDLDFAERVPESFAERILNLRQSQATRSILRRYNHVAAVSDQLAAHIRRVNPRACVHAIPLSLDLSLYPLLRDTPERTPVLGLIGSFNWQPTVAAGLRLVRDLWPAIHRQVPSARLRLIGRDACSAMRDYRGRPDIELIENVPDILPYFSELDVMLYPPRHGSGMKVKVMEAFALGLPVVTTAAGVEGMPARDGIEAGIAETDEGLIARSVALLGDSSLRQARRRQAREFMERQCNAARSFAALDAVYASMAGVAPSYPDLISAGAV